jgi:AraC family transcriptional regulator of adaptative response / DNA-3-methyladenine glycosylase II
MTLPALQVCEQARASRDPRFDGLFFIAVASTGIYCRPVCPARSPKPENVRYYPTAAAAEAAGFRPCLRCRPELPTSESWRRGDAHVARALELIEDGFLADNSLAALADCLGVSERQLRRLFVARWGVTPSSLHNTRRLCFAKQLLAETSLPILDVALESGFNSVRRFNACSRDAYGLTPSAVRRKPGQASARAQALTLRLEYRPPYDLAARLDALRRDAIAGLEEVGAGSYTRVFGPAEAPGWLRVSAWPGKQNALRLEVHCRRPTRILEIVRRLRRMFDLDADALIINAALSEDPGLRPLVEASPGLRLPAGWDGFEVAVRNVLARAGDHADGQTLARVLERYGSLVELSSGCGPDRLFPQPEALVDADLTAVGVSGQGDATVRAIARGLLDGRLDFRHDRTLEDFVGRWTVLPGVRRETAHGIALGAIGHPDAFPVEGILQDAARDSPLATPELAAERAERWRPWRAYALVHLWHAAIGAERA